MELSDNRYWGKVSEDEECHVTRHEVYANMKQFVLIVPDDLR